jgi:AraC-like DNA-binding protein
MDLDTPCIPLGHILTYFNIAQKPEVGMAAPLYDEDERAVQLNKLMQVSMGLDHQDMFRRVGVDLAEGNISERFLTARQVLGLTDIAIQHMNMPYLGLFVGNIMTVSHHGLAGLTCVTQPTLRECSEMTARLCRELFPPLEMSVHEADGLVWLAIDENISLAPYTHYFMELNSISFYNIVRDLVGRVPELEPIAVEFSYPEPEWGHIYRRYFKCPVRFDCAQTRIIRKSGSADFELPLANRLMAMTAEKSLFQRIPTRAMQFLPLRLRHFLVRSYGAMPSLERAASELGMSGRTLRRRLAEDGTTYQKEMDVIRERFARGYFARGGHSVSELSELLGFSSSQAFSRAFTRWTGKKPADFIKREVSKPEA